MLHMLTLINLALNSRLYSFPFHVLLKYLVTTTLLNGLSFSLGLNSLCLIIISKQTKNQQ